MALEKYNIFLNNKCYFLLLNVYNQIIFTTDLNVLREVVEFVV